MLWLLVVGSNPGLADDQWILQWIDTSWGNQLVILCGDELAACHVNTAKYVHVSNVYKLKPVSREKAISRRQLTISVNIEDNI